RQPGQERLPMLQRRLRQERRRHRLVGQCQRHVTAPSGRGLGPYVPPRTRALKRNREVATVRERLTETLQRSRCRGHADGARCHGFSYPCHRASSPRRGLTFIVTSAAPGSAWLSIPPLRTPERTGRVQPPEAARRVPFRSLGTPGRHRTRRPGQTPPPVGTRTESSTPAHPSPQPSRSQRYGTPPTRPESPPRRSLAAGAARLRRPVPGQRPRPPTRPSPG